MSSYAHRSKAEVDGILRRHALDKVRTIVARLRDGDPAVEVKNESEWRHNKLTQAAKWAQIAEALRPDPEPKPVEVTFNGFTEFDTAAKLRAAIDAAITEGIGR